MHNLNEYEVWKQRAEDIRREVERNRLARVSKGWRPGILAVLWWELQRDAGRLRKWLRGGGS